MLGRDRFGEKPLYYGHSNNTFLFGSELKAFKKHPSFNCEINRDAINFLMKHSYIPAPYCIFKGFNKLMPGHIITLTASNAAGVIECYWDVNSSIQMVWIIVS